MKYKHKNLGNSIAIIHDKKMSPYRLEPGDECIIDKPSAQGFVKLIEEIDSKSKFVSYTEKKIKNKKKKSWRND